MKIELKNIKFSEAMSEETNAFTANLYINGKNVGYCVNRGCGGCTDYNSHSPELRKVIVDAEAYCKSLPDIDYGDFSINNNLEHTIDQLFEDWLKAKEQKKLQKQMQSAILLGVPDGMSYTKYAWKGKSLSEIPKGALQMTVNELKKKCTGGVTILNTNLEALGINV